MIPFNELREKLQRPRKSVDSWYGKWVMRPVSIYITWFFHQWGLWPNQVTLLSLIAGVIGIFSFATSHFFLGILGVNLWYLLDHVDGEISRLREMKSLTGCFFDTVLNFIVQPGTFLGLAIGLASYSQDTAILFWGIVATLGSVLLMAIPMTEESILFNEARKKQDVFKKLGASNPEVENIQPKKDLIRQIFGLVHTWITFPSVLVVMTVGFLFLLCSGNLDRISDFLNHLLVLYSLLVVVICAVQLFYKISLSSLDRDWK